MTTGREIRCFDYVNHPYEQVRAALTDAAAGTLFANATRRASSRTKSLAAELHVTIGGLEVATEIAIQVKRIEEGEGPKARPATRVHLEWQAAQSPSLFPFMRAALTVYPLTPTETQLELSGRYEPPLWALGSAVDAVVGHRIAEASVHRFVADVADYLRKTLAKSPAG